MRRRGERSSCSQVTERVVREGPAVPERRDRVRLPVREKGERESHSEVGGAAAPERRVRVRLTVREKRERGRERVTVKREGPAAPPERLSMITHFISAILHYGQLE